MQLPEFIKRKRNGAPAATSTCADASVDRYADKQDLRFS
jgi:hypothetical protein